jgi:hypothetical protein
MSKLEDGSGGAIHCRRSFRDSFSMREVNLSWLAVIMLGDYERFSSLTCLDVSCISTMVSTTPNRVRLRTNLEVGV